ncbi:MAG TPA: MBL fold metallo-hydrolase [Gemmatimonadaceae bacterium]|nr:MBL fold metallo-hydrolase [Gemmatimonadaceae bacterium]
MFVRARIHRLAVVASALIAEAVAVPSLRAQNFDTVQVRATPVAGAVHVLVGSGGNIGLMVGDDAVFVVDDQFAPLTPKVLAAIKSVTADPVRFVVNTHWHFDHTGGNENMGKAGALIFAHENVRRRMSTDQFIEALNRKEPAAPKGALPVVTFTEGVSFHLNGDSIVVFHVPPAHTDGDAVVMFTRANVVHTGDLFVSAGFPFVDRSSGGSIHGIIGAAERVLAVTNAQTRIIPGHGPLADRARLQAYHDMLVVMRDRMRKEVAAKHTIEQVLASKITADYDASWTTGRERFLRILFQELSAR